MIYQLASLEKWVRTTINPEILILAISDALLKDQLEYVTGEKERICDYFRDKAIKENSPTLTFKFIRTHQVDITTIADIIIGYSKLPEVNQFSHLKTFYFKASLIIEEIINFIQHHLPEYFDEELPITFMNAELSRKYLDTQLQSFQPLSQNPSIDQALLRIATKPLRDFTEEGKSASYRALGYLKELASSLKGLLDFDHSTDITYEMHLTLFQLNFNYPRYVLHYSYWLDAKLVQIPERPKRLDQLSWHIYAIKQVRFKPGAVLIPGLPSLPEQLLTSIKTTYKHLLADEMASNHTVAEQIRSANKFREGKIRLAVSVPVLALFLKIFIKAGIITNENKSEVFRVVAENFTTLKSEAISHDSLKGKYNKTPAVTYLHLRTALNKALELLRHV